ncbi:hypothetical protein [Phenylobacterium sp.]|uniref:hypothetical protein n=1 Tax=Phenylobacterium sp. TaxID=1871053 RepID=UPI0025FF672A|nr:hypothetical protein [Phenylobacterium sp.]MBX3484617.1 hypothetical protein [Phenylobacterium sp.]MCW5758834.1 hypothetical protein [Phenylobacterium sp.]
MSVPARTYIRFVCFLLVQGQRNRLGLFQALNEARDSDHAPDWALKEIGELRGWFDDNLERPETFGRGQSGLSWFKPAAAEHIANMHRLKLALEACGVHVEVLTTRDPGAVVWQDKHQVVAQAGARRF